MTGPAQALQTLPWSWYSDAEVAALERESIFHRAWQYIGHLGELQGPGSYFATHPGGVPVVITRDRDGALHGFLNVCRHRGTVVARGAQKRGTLQCPYHAWTYDLDGALRAAPRSSRDPSFDARELCLRPVAIATWGPFVFANPDPDCESFAEALGDLPAIVAEGGLDVEQLSFHSRVSYELRANWKIAIENYLECYHCAVNHPSLVEVIDERSLRLEASGLRVSQSAPAHRRVAEGTAPFDARGPLDSARYHLLLPATKLNSLPGHPNLSIGPVWPTATDRCGGFLDYFFGPGADDAWIRELFAIDDVVGNEDTALIEAAQAGSANGILEHGRLLAGSDDLVAYFQRYVRSRLEYRAA
ncbi:MAG TPA: aromatic ring-hydroxylating dioxygenase subunit alpha [Solirubrobacteraceae bacterium]